MWYLDSYLKYILLISVLYILIRFFSIRFAIKIRKYVFPFIFVLFLGIYNIYSMIFYLFLVFSNYFFAIILYKNEKIKKYNFIISIIFNIILFIFINTKNYFNLINLDHISFIGFNYAFLKIIDIHFYIYFYEENIKILDVMNYIFFIPVFTSGPITIFNDFKKQINNLNEKNLNFSKPIKRIIIGFFKKIVCVKILMEIHDKILLGDLDFKLSFMLLFLFYIIGYLDFSGYSDIAIGFSNILGLDVPENFKLPFLSPSLTIFWKNWHISLGNWIKGHITIFIKPKSRLHSGLSSFLIMLFVGVWHKFSFLFFLWGVWHGFFLFIESYFNLGIVNKKKTSSVIYYFRCFLTNLVVIFGCIFFYVDFDTAIKVLKGFLIF